MLVSQRFYLLLQFEPTGVLAGGFVLGLLEPPLQISVVVAGLFFQSVVVVLQLGYLLLQGVDGGLAGAVLLLRLYLVEF